MSDEVKPWLTGKPYYCNSCGLGGAEVMVKMVHVKWKPKPKQLHVAINPPARVGRDKGRRTHV